MIALYPDGDLFHIYEWSNPNADSGHCLGVACASVAFRIARAAADEKGCELQLPKPALNLIDGGAA